MNTLPSGCSYTKLWVSPQNWNTTQSQNALKKTWYVQCYFFDPEYAEKYPKGFQFRRKLNKWKTLAERKAAAQFSLDEIPKIFEQQGFNPITGKFSEEYMASLPKTECEEQSTSDVSFKGNLTAFIFKNRKQLDDGVIRKDTLRAYTSYSDNIIGFLRYKKRLDMLLKDFSRPFVFEFLDYIYHHRENSPTTRNNYLQFLVNVGNFFVDRGLIEFNPAIGIKRITETPKKRVVIPARDREIIREYLAVNNPEFLHLSMLTYYCFVRRTELTKLKVQDVQLVRGVLLITSETAKKSKKTEPVTIPKPMVDYLIKHLKHASNDMYLFSMDGFKPGTVPLYPKKISDTWRIMIDKLKMPASYQFYALKDTGITELLNAGVPSYKVQKQARHSELAMTEKYINKRYDHDNEIFNTASSF